MLRFYINGIKNGEFVFMIQKKLGLTDKMQDEIYLKHFYHMYTGKNLNLDKPVLFNEKLQWLKLYFRKPELSLFVDKYKVKEYISAVLGEEYVVQLLGVWDNFDDIDFENLPNQFVIKCTHDSAGLVICRDKDKLDINNIKKKITECLKRDFYLAGREWPYKNVKPRIIIEEYLEDERDGELRDYKFFCFGGVPKVMYIAKGRGNNSATADFFDMNFKHLDLMIDHEMSEIPPHKPANFDKMKEFAAVLSKNLPHVRVDFYEVNGRLYFGEMTFFHCGGFYPFKTPEWEETLGSWIDLPEVTV